MNNVLHILYVQYVTHLNNLQYVKYLNVQCVWVTAGNFKNEISNTCMLNFGNS